MSTFVVELEGADAQLAVEAGRKFLSGESLLTALAEMAGIPRESILSTPPDLNVEYGLHTPEQYAAIQAAVDLEVRSAGGVPEGFELDMPAPAWAILTIPSLPADNMTYRLRTNGAFDPIMAGVEI